MWIIKQYYEKFLPGIAIPVVNFYQSIMKDQQCTHYLLYTDYLICSNPSMQRLALSSLRRELESRKLVNTHSNLRILVFLSLNPEYCALSWEHSGLKCGQGKLKSSLSHAVIWMCETKSLIFIIYYYSFYVCG